jgi:hypothetical protein
MLPLFAAILCFMAANAKSQEITAISPEVHTFNSPMVLEYTLDRFLSGIGRDVFPEHKAHALPQKISWDPVVVTDVRNYTCRGVTLERFTLELTRFEAEPFRRLKIVSELFNNSGKDKQVTIVFALVKAGDIIATETLKGLRVQQGAFAQSSRGQPASPQELTIRIPPSADGEPYPKLRITMTLNDY